MCRMWRPDHRQVLTPCNGALLAHRLSQMFLLSGTAGRNRNILFHKVRHDSLQEWLHTVRQSFFFPRGKATLDTGYHGDLHGNQYAKPCLIVTMATSMVTSMRSHASNRQFSMWRCLSVVRVKHAAIFKLFVTDKNSPWIHLKFGPK